MPSDPPTRPLPLADRIVIALDQLRIARAEGDPTREWSWAEMMDKLLDRYSQGHR